MTLALNLLRWMELPILNRSHFSLFKGIGLIFWIICLTFSNSANFDSKIWENYQNVLVLNFRRVLQMGCLTRADQINNEWFKDPSFPHNSRLSSAPKKFQKLLGVENSKVLVLTRYSGISYLRSIYIMWVLLEISVPIVFEFRNLKNLGNV